jgi:hypothetical protein
MRILLGALEERGRAAFVELRASEIHPLHNIGSFAANAERQGCVQRDDVRARGPLAREYGFKRFPATRDRSAANFFERRAHAIVRGIQRPAFAQAFAELIHGRRPFAANLIDTAGRVNDRARAHAERAQHVADKLQVLLARDADELMRSSRRSGQRSENIKDGANAEFAPDVCDVLHRRMIDWGEHEGEAHVTEASSSSLGRKLDRHAVGFQEIGASALPRSCAITMLGYGNSRCGNDQRSERRDVYRARAVATAADDVYDQR